MALPSASDFEAEVRSRWFAAQQSGTTFVDIESGDVHRNLGGYPGNNHRMPVCCEVMRRLLGPRDTVLTEPPKGQGASLLVRYALPR
jgi:hypothetical protein